MLKIQHLTSEHELIGIIRNGEDVGWSLHSLLASVCHNNLSIVHREPLVGVHHDTEQARVSLEKRRKFAYNFIISMFDIYTII